MRTLSRRFDMLTFSRTRLRFKTPFVSKKQQLIDAIKSHAAWRGNVSLCEAAALLKGNDPFTFIVSEGMDECHFFLSFVDSDRVVKHKNVRVLVDRGNWVVKNGQGLSFPNLDLLVPNCLHCSASVSKPLA